MSSEIKNRIDINPDDKAVTLEIDRQQSPDNYGFDRIRVRLDYVKKSQDSSELKPVLKLDGHPDWAQNMPDKWLNQIRDIKTEEAIEFVRVAAVSLPRDNESTFRDICTAAEEAIKQDLRSISWDRRMHRLPLSVS